MPDPTSETPPEPNNHATVPEAVQHLETAVTTAAQQVGVSYVLTNAGIFGALIQGFSIVFIFWLAAMQQHRYLTHIDFLPILSTVLGINVVGIVTYALLWRRGTRR